MTTVKVIITTQDGEVLEEFVAAPFREKFEDGPTSLAMTIRDAIEHRFNVADTLEGMLENERMIQEELRDKTQRRKEEK